jgi:hypothetical protein
MNLGELGFALDSRDFFFWGGDRLHFGMREVKFFCKVQTAYQLVYFPGATILCHVILTSVTEGVFESCRLYSLSSSKYKNLVCKITVVFMHNRMLYLDTETK